MKKKGTSSKTPSKKHEKKKEGRTHYTTPTTTKANCVFRNYILVAHARYYDMADDVNLSTQEHFAHGADVSRLGRSLTHNINGYCVSAGTPWHLVDEVYIPVNCFGSFHWVLAVVALKERLIRVYDSMLGRRHRNPSEEIQKLVVMLPTYLQESGFFDKTNWTDWPNLQAYKNKTTDEMIGQEVPFKVELIQGIAQQQSDNVDCGVLVAAYAEYIRSGIPIPTHTLDAEYLRKRCCSANGSMELTRRVMDTLAKMTIHPSLGTSLSPPILIGSPIFLNLNLCKFQLSFLETSACTIKAKQPLLLSFFDVA